MQDLETANIDDLRRTNLLQLGSMDYLGDNWLTTAKVQSFQSLADDISNQYEILPQVTTRYRDSGQPFSLQAIAMAQYSNFGADRDVVTGERLYGEAGLSYPMAWPFGFLTPELKYRQVAYDLSDATTFPDSTPVCRFSGGQPRRRAVFRAQYAIRRQKPAANARASRLLPLQRARGPDRPAPSSTVQS